MAKSIVICGPTASGKTALAVELAQKLGAVIINADSQQVYREIPILSAQPSAEEKNAVEHQLFGVISGAENFNAGRWLELAQNLIAKNKISIIVGGTGMYLNALYNGLSPIPEIPAEIREKVRAMEISEVAKALGSKFDGNSQRGRRALEVKLTTGKDMEEFHSIVVSTPNNPLDYIIFNLDVPRETIYARINNRFTKMLENGGMEEARNLAKMKLDKAMPILKACGVPEIFRHLDGEISYDEMLELAQTKTRQYAKRQMTWFRNQLPEHAVNITNLDGALKSLTNSKLHITN